jgi:hypothetical protein
MLTLTSSNSTSNTVVTLIKLSVICPVCGWYYSGHVTFPEPPFCNDKQCMGCKTLFKARYKVREGACEHCDHKVRCVSMPVAEVQETLAYPTLGDINWSM